MNSMPDLCAYCISPVRMPEFLQKPQRSRWKSIQDMTTTYCRLDQKGKQQLSLIHGEKVRFSLWPLQSMLKKKPNKPPSILNSPSASLVVLPCQSFCIWQNETNRKHRAVDEYQNREDRQAEDMLNF